MFFQIQFARKRIRSHCTLNWGELHTFQTIDGLLLSYDGEDVLLRGIGRRHIVEVKVFLLLLVVSVYNDRIFEVWIELDATSSFLEQRPMV